MCRSDIDNTLAAFGAALIVLAQATVASEPAEGAFDHPAARQNLETQQQKANSELSEREKAVEALVKPIRDALDASQKQISELEKARSEAYGSIRTHLEAMQVVRQIKTVGVWSRNFDHARGFAGRAAARTC